MTMGLWLGEWAEAGKNNVANLDREFEMRTGLDDSQVLLAWYGGGLYEGNAFVLFEKDGRLYEVNAGHCSCSGLEGQWDPEETSVSALRYRVANGTLGHSAIFRENYFADELIEVLDEWERRKSG